ncbi:MAG TPA: radical SAM protein [Terriglobales bacterium]|nr:radical SAM protein [Terriglobales bacterium]
MNNKTVLVSAGLLAPKKTDHMAARRHRYLNYGLLTLGTILARKGYPVQMLHGGFCAPDVVAERLLRDCSQDSPLLLLSLPSFISIPWARLFLETVKRECPTGPAGIEPSASKFIQLDYALDQDFPDFQPSIEVSRGCGMGCRFCEERLAPLGQIRAADDVVSAVAAAFDIYNTTSINFYFEASFFLATERWAAQLAEGSKKSGLRFAWRCETRVDALTTPALRRLAEAGLRVVDLGLESASPRQLLRMKKSGNSQLYLRRASELLRQCRDNGIWTKVNVLLYPGETPETLAETTDWLDKHRECIKGVSVAPIVVYGHGDEARRDLEELALLGASAVDSTSLESSGVTHLHLSPSIDYESSWALSRYLSRMFMTHRDYYDLKKFSYFSRRYTYPQFLRDMGHASQELLPFRSGPPSGDSDTDSPTATAPQRHQLASGPTTRR